MTNLICKNEYVSDKKMNVIFMTDRGIIKYFDIKQMICHLLGIATAYLLGEFSNKKIDFIYLLYNPLRLQIEEEEYRREIYRIYQQVYQECNSVDFKAVFRR